MVKHAQLFNNGANAYVRITNKTIDATTTNDTDPDSKFSLVLVLNKQVEEGYYRYQLCGEGVHPLFACALPGRYFVEVESHTCRQLPYAEQGMKESNLGPLDHQMKALPPVFYVYIYQTNFIDTGQLYQF